MFNQVFFTYEKIYSSNQQMALREAQLLTLNVLKQVMEEKLDQHNVQLAQVCSLCDIKYYLFIRSAL
jgi:hypothetical protein